MTERKKDPRSCVRILGGKAGATMGVEKLRWMAWALDWDLWTRSNLLSDNKAEGSAKQFV